MSLAPENLPTLVQCITVNSTHIIFSAIRTLMTTLLKIRKRSTKKLLRWKDKKRPEKREKLWQQDLADTEPLVAVEDATEKQPEEPRETKLGRLTRYSPKSELRANLEDFIGGGERTEMQLMRRSRKPLRPKIRTRFTLKDTASIRSTSTFTSTNLRLNLKLCQPSISSL
jgi:hypothetical protein